MDNLFEVSSLAEVYADSTLESIYKSEETTKKGFLKKTFNVAEIPSLYYGGFNARRVYNVSIMIDPKVNKSKSVVTVSVSNIQFVPGKCNACDRFFLNEKESTFGELYFYIPAKAWNTMRNGIFTAVFDYIDTQVNKYYV